MTGKRFTYNVNKNCIEYDGKFVAYLNSIDGCRIANYWNTLYKENKQLKHQLQQQELEYAETCHRLKEENEKLESLWEDKCIREYAGIVGEYALQEMHDKKYGDKE